MSHLTTIAPLVAIMAAERTSDPDAFDEARQEGLIAAWQTEEARPDASRQYVTAAARNGVNGSLAGRSPFGAPSRRGRAEPLNSAAPLTFDEGDDEDTSGALEDRSTPLAFHLAEISSARSEVREVIAGLDKGDLEIVRRRFWQEQTWPEIAVDLGKRTEAVRRRFVDHIAPALAADLGHLREVTA